jgi:hypothetical protein
MIRNIGAKVQLRAVAQRPACDQQTVVLAKLSGSEHRVAEMRHELIPADLQ